jgi:protein O-GlcNAc transferase
MLTIALRHYQNGELQKAEEMLLELLQADKETAETLYYLGLIAHKKNRHRDAIEYLCRAITINPGQGNTHLILGDAYRSAGQIDQAIEAYRRAIHVDPSLAEAHNNLGDLYFQQNRLDEAATCFRRAIQIAPKLWPAYVNLGATHCRRNEFDEGKTCFEKAIEGAPDFAPAHVNLGHLFYNRGELNLALNCYERALEINYGSPIVHNNVGTIRYRLLEYQNAEQSFRHAISLWPEYADAHSNLANVLNEQGKVEEARQSYQHALRLRPSQPLLEFRLATTCPVIFPSAAEIDRYRKQLLEILGSYPARRMRVSVEELLTVGPYPPYALMYQGRDDCPIKLAYARVFRNCFDPMDAPHIVGKYRVGFVVTDGHEKIFLRSMRGVLKHLDKTLFDLSIICSNRGLGMLRGTLSDTGITLLPLLDDLPRAPHLMRAAAFDLLYYWEVGTDAANYFLPFMRLARVQCTSWGVQVTTGIPNMDAYLSSVLVEPHDAETHYSERLVRARTFLTYQYPQAFPKNGKTRMDFGFSPAQHLYLCAQQIGKFNPDFDAILAGVLRQDPHGILVITADRWGYVTRQLLKRFKRNMPDVIGRIAVLKRLSHEDYLALVAASDVILDPPYYGGVNTTYDSISLGKAVVSMPSDFHIGRYTSACFNKMGVAECVALTPDEFISLAVRLGIDAEHRSFVETKIRNANHVLFEDMESVREHERIFRELIESARGR